MVVYANDGNIQAVICFSVVLGCTQVFSFNISDEVYILLIAFHYVVRSVDNRTSHPHP